MTRKGRAATGTRNGVFTHADSRRRGEHHGNAKLTEAQVLEIRALHGSGVAQRQLARQFGVDRRSISFIVSGKYWTHI